MDMLNKGKLYLITALTAGAMGLTFNHAWKNYNEMKAFDTFERAATSYFIVTDKSMKRIRKNQQVMSDLLNELQDCSSGNLESLIEDQRKDADFIRDSLARTDEEISELYSEARQRIEEIAKMPLENMERYSRLWRRAVKVKGFINYEYITFADRKIDAEDTATDHVLGFANWWIESVLNKEAKDSERMYEALKLKLQAYTDAEIEKQGLANIMEDLNGFMEDKKLTRGEQKMYELIKDSIRETGDNEQALQIIDYLKDGKIPDDIEPGARDTLEAQANMFDYINKAQELVERKVYLINKAENIGLKLEDEGYKVLDKIEKRYASLRELIEESRSQMADMDIEYRDPEFDKLQDTMKQYYWGFFGAIMLLEFGIGYTVSRSAREKDRYHKLKRLEEEIYAKRDTDRTEFVQEE